MSEDKRTPMELFYEAQSAGLQYGRRMLLFGVVVGAVFGAWAMAVLR